jgi:hypothetical protein
VASAAAVLRLLRGELGPHLRAVQWMQAQQDGGGEGDDRRGRAGAARLLEAS